VLWLLCSSLRYCLKAPDKGRFFWVLSGYIVGKFNGTANIRTPIHIWRFVDGRPGHEKQTAGLIQGFEEILNGQSDTELVQDNGFAVTTVSLPEDLPWLKRQWGESVPQPDLLVGAGRAVQRAMLRTRWHLGGKTVVLMKPSLPLFLFDLILLPKHDSAPNRPNILRTTGMLSPVVAGQKDPAKGVVLLGGVNEHFRWDDDEIAAQVAALTGSMPGVHWQISDSPRTPQTLQVKLSLPENASLVHWRDTPDGWLSNQLATSGYVWVSADSASMLYEALSHGGRVGVIELAPYKEKNKLVRGLGLLLEKGLLGRSSRGALELQKLNELSLAEHTRCAQWIIDKWFAGV
jgi:mitochondrial fission protein ELM1